MHSTALVAGIIVGAGIFVQPAEIARHVPSASGVMLVWIISGLFTLCGALVCAELGSAFPQTGGVYVFLKETMSPALGFLWGWAMFWSIHTGIIAASGVIFARYVGFFAPLGDVGIRVVAIAGILALSALNYMGVRQGSLLQTIVTAAKVLAIALMALLVVGFPGSGRAAAAVTKEISSREFFLAVAAGLYAFGGWHMATYAAGETRDPEKTVPRALLLGVAVVTACYLGLNAACLYVLPLDQVMSSTRVAADAAHALAGPRGAAAVSALVIVSSFGCMNGIILSGPRVYYAMAQDGLGFAWMGAVHERFRTPHLAILLQAAWACTLVWEGTYRALFTRVIYTEWLLFALMTVGLLRLRHKSGKGFAPAPILFLIACASVVLNQIAADPRESATGLLLVLAGLPVYYFWARRKGRYADH